MTMPPRTPVPSDRVLNLAPPQRRTWLTAVLATLALACGLPARGATPIRALPAEPAPEPAGLWPSRPVTMVVPFPAGGANDVFALPLAAEFASLTGQTLRLQYRDGLGGTRGASVAAHAAPDGYTLFMGGVHHAIAATLRPGLDYLLDADFVPLALLATMPQVLVVDPARFPGDFASLVDKLHIYPGRYSYGSAGNGTSYHIAGELFRRAMRARILHTPFRGSGQALAALVAGNVDMVFCDVGSAVPHIRAGRLKALMVSGSQRNPAIPNVPTAAELEIPGFDGGTWYGLWAPKGTPVDVRTRIIDVVQRASDTQAIQIAWMDAGAEFPALTGKAFGDFVEAEMRRWAAVIKAKGITLE